MADCSGVFAMPVGVFSQTQIKYHSNKYKPTDDVKVGRQAAAEVEQQLPILRDAEATSYLSRLDSGWSIQFRRVPASRVSILF